MKTICKECQKEFETRKGLHLHLKAHFSSIGEYYIKFNPKKDLYSGEPIHFKKYEQYEESDFNSYDNYLSWISFADPQEVKKYILSKAELRFGVKGVKKSLPNVYYRLAEMACIDDYKRLWGSYGQFIKEVGLENGYVNMLPKDFWDLDNSDIEIFVDTREQKPLQFVNGIQNKLDFGDYTAGGELYSKTFVDRKALGDFKQTFGAGAERFAREMDRCVHFKSYMFVVVESSIDFIEEDNKHSKFKSNMGYVWHNVRNMIEKYPDNLQFIFAHSRGGAQKIIPKILYHGTSLWRTDLQYFIDKKINVG